MNELIAPICAIVIGVALWACSGLRNESMHAKPKKK